MKIREVLKEERSARKTLGQHADLLRDVLAASQQLCAILHNEPINNVEVLPAVELLLSLNAVLVAVEVENAGGVAFPDLLYSALCYAHDGLRSIARHVENAARKLSASFGAAVIAGLSSSPFRVALLPVVAPLYVMIRHHLLDHVTSVCTSCTCESTVCVLEAVVVGCGGGAIVASLRKRGHLMFAVDENDPRYDNVEVIEWLQGVIAGASTLDRRSNPRKLIEKCAGDGKKKKKKPSWGHSWGTKKKRHPTAEDHEENGAEDSTWQEEEEVGRRGENESNVEDDNWTRVLRERLGAEGRSTQLRQTLCTVTVDTSHIAVLHSRERVPFRLPLIVTEGSKSSEQQIEPQVVSFVVKPADDIWMEAVLLGATEVVNALVGGLENERGESTAPVAVTYGVVPTSARCGAVHVVPGGRSIHDCIAAGLSNDQIAASIRGNRTSMQHFLRTASGAALVEYLFGVKDRHNANVLLAYESDYSAGPAEGSAGGLGSCGRCSYVNVDFGFVFGNAPGGILSVESGAPFRLTKFFQRLLLDTEQVSEAEKKREENSTVVQPCASSNTFVDSFALGIARIHARRDILIRYVSTASLCATSWFSSLWSPDDAEKKANRRRLKSSQSQRFLDAVREAQRRADFVAARLDPSDDDEDEQDQEAVAAPGTLSGPSPRLRRWGSELVEKAAKHSGWKRYDVFQQGSNGINVL